MRTHEMTYQLDEDERAVLDVVREENRVNPLVVREETGLRKQEVNTILNQLQKAGFIWKRARGLYVFERDPEEAV